MIAQDVASHGFAIVENVLNLTDVHQLQILMPSAAGTGQSRGGIRNLLDLQEVRMLATSAAIMALIKPILA